MLAARFRAAGRSRLVSVLRRAVSRQGGDESSGYVHPSISLPSRSRNLKLQISDVPAHRPAPNDLLDSATGW